MAALSFVSALPLAEAEAEALSSYRGSIVVPVHNEEGLILQFLDAFKRDGVLDDYEVVIACNNCSDHTAELARTVEGVVVAETEVGGKCAGLNLGDDNATAFPRLYLDVDVDISKTTLDRVAEELSDGPTLAAAPSVIIDLDGRSPFVKAYYTIWTRLPWATNEMIGSGLYAMSEAGRGRFGIFPEDVVDDLFVTAHFAPGERRNLKDVSFRVPSSGSLREIVQRKSRLLTYNRRTAPHIVDLPGRPEGRGGFVSVVATRPWLWPAGAVYAVVAVLSERGARKRWAASEWAWDGSQRD